MSEKRGVLYLVPNLLDPSSSPEATLPAAAIAKVRELRRFVVEGDKAAWRLLSRILEPEEAKAVAMERLDEHTRAEDIPSLLSPLESGEDIGLISEAGMPCVADPGAALAALAHDRGFRVVPLVGPSSILLALAASGLDGQRFSFLGYLPPDPSGRKSALASMDRSIKADGATRIFIETPYRNDRLLDDCLGVLSGGTRLCVAASLLSAEERVISKSVASWKAGPRAVIGKVPAIFLAGMSARAGAGTSSGAGATRDKERGLDLRAGRRHS
jgi:16S rRNA (cytidine1402-2'-O)-methyltransferase